MPSRPTEQQLYNELLDRYGRQIADAFQSAINDLRSRADLQALQRAIDAGDLNAAVEALHLDPAAYNPLLDAIRNAYMAGGQAAVTYMPKIAGMVIRFDGRHYAAEQWLKDHSAQLVSRIVEDQKQAIRNALTAGMARGANPTTTALEIVGRIDKATGERQGGIVGLTSQQSSYVENARQELSGADPEGLRNYLTRSLRDKRFDRTVQKAINDGTPIPADIQAKAVQQYSNRLLKLRGSVIGSEESFAALRASKDEAFRQAIERGAFPAGAVEKNWRHNPSPHPRAWHIEMNGARVAFDQPFVLPNGVRMRYPGDRSLGAGAEDIIGCHCMATYRLNFQPRT